MPICQFLGVTTIMKDRQHKYDRPATTVSLHGHIPWPLMISTRNKLSPPPSGWTKKTGHLDQRVPHFGWSHKCWLVSSSRRHLVPGPRVHLRHHLGDYWAHLWVGLVLGDVGRVAHHCRQHTGSEPLQIKSITMCSRTMYTAAASSTHSYKAANTYWYQIVLS
jgi:hypothetical protein